MSGAAPSEITSVRVTVPAVAVIPALMIVGGLALAGVAFELSPHAFLPCMLGGLLLVPCGAIALPILVYSPPMHRIRGSARFDPKGLSVDDRLLLPADSIVGVRLTSSGFRLLDTKLDEVDVSTADGVDRAAMLRVVGVDVERAAVRHRGSSHVARASAWVLLPSVVLALLVLTVLIDGVAEGDVPFIWPLAWVGACIVPLGIPTTVVIAPDGWFVRWLGVRYLAPAGATPPVWTGVVPPPPRRSSRRPTSGDYLRDAIARGKRSSGAWLAGLRACVQPGGYRALAITADRLWAIADDPRAPADERAGAVVALVLAFDGEGTRRRLRELSRETAVPTLRSLLAASADGRATTETDLDPLRS